MLPQNVKKTNPGIAFTEVGRVLGDKWKKMTGKLDHCTSIQQIIACIIQQHRNTFPSVLNVFAVEEKEPYEAKAQQDKKRYKDEISGYKNPQPMNIDSGNESDSAQISLDNIILQFLCKCCIGQLGLILDICGIFDNVSMHVQLEAIFFFP